MLATWPIEIAFTVTAMDKQTNLFFSYFHVQPTFRLNSWQQWPNSVVDKDNKEISSIA